MRAFVKLSALAALAAAVAASTAAAMSPLMASHAAPPDQIVAYVMPGEMGFVGPDGKHHDTIAPSGFVLHRGVPATFKIVNYDDGMHTIFAPDLGLEVTIEAGHHAKGGGVTPATTTVTFTPEKRGEFRWQCAVMCDGPSHWAMSDGYDGADRDGFMAGWIKVL